MNPSTRQKLKLIPIHISPVYLNPFSEVIFLLITTMFITHLLSFKSSLIPSIWLAKTYFRFQLYFIRGTVQDVIFELTFHSCMADIHLYWCTPLQIVCMNHCIICCSPEQSAQCFTVSLLMIGMWLFPHFLLLSTAQKTKPKTFYSMSRISAIFLLVGMYLGESSQQHTMLNSRQSPSYLRSCGQYVRVPHPSH